ASSVRRRTTDRMAVRTTRTTRDGSGSMRTVLGLGGAGERRRSRMDRHLKHVACRPRAIR
ncbi:MAG TPA: hypothetical protein VGI97_02380, partial [Gemmatimonadaceae bacterium]